ncbi:unnamed protein product, partial [Rotaria sp. Silwood2]
MTLTKQPSARMVVFENIVFKNDNGSDNDNSVISVEPSIKVQEKQHIQRPNVLMRLSKKFSNFPKLTVPMENFPSISLSQPTILVSPPSSPFERQNSSESDLSLSKLDINDDYSGIQQNNILQKTTDLNINKRKLSFPTSQQLTESFQNFYSRFSLKRSTMKINSSSSSNIITQNASSSTIDKHDTTTKKNEHNIRLQLSFQYNIHRREFIVTVHGARDLTIQQGSFACQLSIQYGRDSLSKEQKCTKPQACSSGICTWNQRLIFFDIDTLDNLSLWAKLIDLDRNQEILGEIYISLNDKKLNLNGQPEWYNLISKYSSLHQLQIKNFQLNDSDTSEIEQHESSFNRILPTINANNELLPTMIDTITTSNRKRQLPNIPAAQLHANREKVSQDLIQKATQLKLRLHMQQQQQRTLNETNLNEKRLMYEDRIQIFNNEANRPISKIPSISSQRTSFQSSKSIDTDSPNIHQTSILPKPYDSMTNLTEKPSSVISSTTTKATTTTTNSGLLKEKTPSRPRIPIIRDKSAPNAPYLNPSLSRRTTTAGQARMDIEKSKLKSFEERYKKNIKKRVTNSGQSINLREEDLTDENDENSKDLTTPIISSLSSSNDKIFVVVDMKSSEISQTIGFIPNDNSEIIIPSSINTAFNTFIFSFRTRSNVSTLIEFEQISLNIDVDGYLALVIRDKQAQRILSNDEQKPINDGNLYTVYLQRTDKNLDAWIIKNKNFKPNKISIELSTSKLIVENFIFGPRSQFIGCLQNITYNDQLLSFKHLSFNRQQCPSSSIALKSAEILSYNNIYIDQIISFKEYDRPLIINLDTPEDFHDFIFEIDGNIIMKKFPTNLRINTIYIGQLDSYIKEKFSDLDGDNFIGCIKDIMLNEKSIVKLDHIHHIGRLTNICQLSKRG